MIEIIFIINNENINLKLNKLKFYKGLIFI